jgi:hypothetical protein
MKKLKAFIYVYTKSLTNLPYYRDILKTGFGFSVKYYLFLALLASILTTTAISIKLVPQSFKIFGDLVNSARSAFPDDLVFSIKSGEWTINRTEPFIVPLPKLGEWEQDSGVKNPTNLVVFDHNGTIEDLDNLDTLILFNKVNVLYREENKISVVPIKDLPDNIINKTEFDKFVSVFVSILKLFPVLMVLMIFVGVLVLNIVFRVFYFAWFSLFVWLASKIIGNSLGYNESVRISIHSATLPLTLGTLFGFFDFVPFPFWFGLVNLLFAVFVLLDMKKFNKTQS